MPDADFFIGGDLSNPLITEKTDLSVALADMISFNDGKVLLTLGGRVQNIEAAPLITIQVMSCQATTIQFTPVVGIVYKSSEQVSYYANYIEGLLPGEVAPASSSGEPIENAGEVLTLTAPSK